MKDYKTEVLQWFYRTDYYEGEEIIDNTSRFIASKVKISTYSVNLILNKHLDEKFKGLNKIHDIYRKINK